MEGGRRPNRRALELLASCRDGCTEARRAQAPDKDRA